MVLKICKIVAIVLLVSVLALTTVNLFYVGDNTNCAIVVVHGMAGGGLVDKDGNPIWDPFGGELYYKNFFTDPIAMIVDIVFGQQYAKNTKQLLDDILANDPNNLIYQLTSDQDGNIKDNGIVAATADSRLPYGPLQAYKDIYQGLYNEFNDDIEVVLFQYDFRQDNYTSAQNLENFINQNGWDEVIICAHSMGSVVTSCYLAKSQENRDKVRGFMSMAGALLGSTNALAVYEQPEIYIGGVYDMLDQLPALKKVIGNKIDNIVQEQILPFINNMASVGQLLPSMEYAHFLKEYYGQAFLTVNGKEITTNEELMIFYLSRPWARKTNGTTKAFMMDLPNFMNSFFGHENGERYHVTQLVNTFYFAGNGLHTATGATVSGDKTKLYYTSLGDGTVPLYSATIGLNPKDNYNVKVYEGKSHLDIGMLYDGQFAQDLTAAIRFLL